MLPPPSTPPPRPAKRSNQRVGEHFESPRKKRAPKKDSAIVVRPGLALRQQQLAAEINALLGTSSADDHSSEKEILGSADRAIEHDDSADCPEEHFILQEDSSHDDAVLSTMDKRPRRVVPDAAAHRLYNNWLSLIPTLVDDYLAYMQQTQGRLGRSPALDTSSCSDGICPVKEFTIQCLHVDCMCTSFIIPYDLLTQIIDLQVTTFRACNCATLPQRLVRNGLFPTSSQQPRFAVSIDLLDFYFALFERSADAVTALAGALKSIYRRRGFAILNGKVCRPSVIRRVILILVPHRESHSRTLFVEVLDKLYNGMTYCVDGRKQP